MNSDALHVRLRPMVAALGAAAIWLVAVVAMAQPPSKTSPAEAVQKFRAAVALQNQQLYDLAAQEWAEFLQAYPEDPLVDRASHYWGVCLFQVGDFRQAEVAFARVVSQYPSSSVVAESQLNLGLAQFNQHTPESLRRAVASLDTFSRQFASNPQGPEADFYRAEALHDLGESKQAAAVFQAWLDAHPDHDLRAQVQYELGAASLDANDPAVAESAFSAFLHHFPENSLASDAALRLGEALLAQEKFAPAAAQFAAAASREDFSLADYAQLRLGLVHFQMQDYVAAAGDFAVFTAKFTTSPHLPEAILSAGKSHYMLGDFATARRWLERVPGSAPDQALEAAHWIARSLLSENKPAEALAVIEQALAAAGDNAQRVTLLLDRADAIFKTPDRKGEAIEMYAAIARDHAEDPLSIEASYLASYAALSLGEYADAIERADQFMARRADSQFAPDVLQVAAESHLQLRQYDQAATTLALMIRQFPQRPEVDAWKVRRALSLQLAGQHQAVVKELEPAAANIEDAAVRAEALHVVGTSQFELKHYEAAERSLSAALVADANWANADETELLLAQALHARGHTEEAIATAQAIDKRHPGSAILDRVAYWLGTKNDERNDRDRADAEFLRAIAHGRAGGLAPYARLEYAWTRIRRNQAADAIAPLTALIDAKPAHALTSQAYYARAVARHQLGQYQPALEDVAAALAASGANAPEGDARSDAIYMQGLCESGLGQFEKAAATLRQLLTDAPTYPAADKVLYEIGWAELSRGAGDAAAEAYERVAKEHSASSLAAESAYRAGELRYDAKQYDQAAEDYATALNRSEAGAPFAESSLHKLAWTHFQLHDLAAAEDGFRMQLSTYPEGALRADAQAMIAECLFQQNRDQAALGAFLKVLDQPGGSEPLRRLAILHAGQTAARQGDWRQSLDILQRNAGAAPDSPYVWEITFERARALQNLGEKEQALGLYQQVAEASPQELGAHARFMIGELRFADKQYEDAVREYFRVVYGYGYPESPEALKRWQADAMFEAARCLELLGRTEAAGRLYQELVERFPDSPHAPAAKQKLAASTGG